MTILYFQTSFAKFYLISSNPSKEFIIKINHSRQELSGTNGISAVAADLFLIEQWHRTDVDVFAFEEKIF